MFCGDGINDLAALAAADVGMSIGATDATIAAELSTSRGSIAGLHLCTSLAAIPSCTCYSILHSFLAMMCY